MAEGSKHLSLVKIIRNAVVNRQNIASNLVLADDHEKATMPPSMPEGYRPDIYYYDNETVIIGEAKSANDLSNGHSNNQFDSYLNYLENQEAKEAFLYVGVPWENFIEQVNRFKRIKKDRNSKVKIIIINDFGFCREL